MKKSPEDRQREFNRILSQAKDGFRKFGKEVGVLAKKSEKGIAKMSKAGKVQLDIMSLNVQKEKLYYDIGKKVASINAEKGLGMPELESYWKKMDRIERDMSGRKKELSVVSKEKK